MTDRNSNYDKRHVWWTSLIEKKNKKKIKCLRKSFNITHCNCNIINISSYINSLENFTNCHVSLLYT